MRWCFLFHQRMSTRNLSLLVLALTSLWLSLPCPSSLSQAQVPPITPSGLNTQISEPIAVGGQTQYDITGGTRPNGGLNLFHSFGDFGIPNNNIANFLNETGLPTSNILGRITGGNMSTVLGAVQTTGFGTANLFLMNPAGFLFGPNATVNVGGMVAFTSADYLRLTDNARFNAIPNSAADALLTASPVAGFGFLGSNPGAITVQGSHFTVTEGNEISLVGGNITIESGTLDNGVVQPAVLSAPGGQINLASVASPGEILLTGLQSSPNINGQSFTTMGNITLSQGATLDVSGNAAGTIRIRGGQFELLNSSAHADTGEANGAETAIDVRVTDDLSISSDSVSAFTARALGSGNAGEIRLDSAKMDANFAFPESGTVIDSSTISSGNGGDVIITTGNLTANNSSLGFGVFIDSGTGGIGNGGNVTIHVQNGDFEGAHINTGDTFFFGTGSAGDLYIGGHNGMADSLRFNALVLSTEAFGAKAGAITLEGQDISITNNTFVSSISLLGENPITINADRLSMDGVVRVQAQTIGPGNGGDIVFTGKRVEMRNESAFISNTSGNGNAGNIRINASEYVRFSDDPGVLTPSGLFTNSIGDTEGVPTRGNAGAIQVITQRLEMTGGARISTTTQTAGRGGDLTITAPEGIFISGQRIGAAPLENFGLGGSDGSGIFSRTIGTDQCGGTCGRAGDLDINTGRLVLQNGGILDSGTTGNGNGGNIVVNASHEIALSGALIDGTPSGIFSRTTGTNPDAGNGGTVLLKANSVIIENGAQISASTLGTGIAGNIILQGPASPAQSVLIDGTGSGIFTNTEGTGAGGNIRIDASQFALSNQATLSAQTAGSGKAGNITVMASSFSMSERPRISAGTGKGTTGDGGNISVQADEVLLTDNASVETNTLGSGDAGFIAITAQDRISLTDSRMNSSTFASPDLPEGGQGGQITLHAPTIDISNGEIVSLSQSSGNAGSIFLETARLTLDAYQLTASAHESGKGGDITIRGLTDAGSSADQVALMGESMVLSETTDRNGGTIAIQTGQLMMQDNSLISTTSQGAGTGGTITVEAANTVGMTSGASITASSTGPGNAGNIMINAGQTFTATNSNDAVTTQADAASGGNITLIATDTVHLTDSRISASVSDGSGKGGNITIDPQYVILQNSQILAEAADGQGGAITITTNLFLPDATSRVSADSGRPGLNGTVTIQSPNSPASGKIQPLGNQPLEATALLNQHCAALAGGEFSSFTVAGRDSLPIEPGGWLASPMARLSADTGLETRGKGLVPSGTSRAGATPLLSLRQIAPPGFLTQGFTVDQTGCIS